MPLIVLEGIDGCGKSTQARLLAARLRACGVEPLELREPGGTALGERLRALLLDPTTRAGAVAEVLLYQAARAQLVEEVLRPVLAAGRTVVLDRFWHSTIAYQAHGLGLDPRPVRAAIDFAVQGLRADLALWFDLPPAEAARRRAAARGEDRIEARGLAYLERVQAGYAALAAAGDLLPIDAARPPAAIAGQVWALAAALLDLPAVPPEVMP